MPPMQSDKQREEVANTHLGDALKTLLPPSFQITAEQKGRADKRLPDVTVKKNGIVIVLEAKYNDFESAVVAAQNRWTQMNPPPTIVGAVSYSPEFQHGFAAAVRKRATVDFALSGDQHLDLSQQKRSGEVYDLAQSLRRPYSVLGDEDEIDKAINNIGGNLSQFASAVIGERGLLLKVAKILQANFEGEKEEEVLEQTAKVAGLILFGALLFQFALAKKSDEVQSPSDLFEKEGVDGLAEHWKFILEKINYAAIFGVARNILQQNITPSQIKALIRAAREVQEVARDGVDLMGRLYHRLLAKAKPLGAFYTSIPAATLMAGLALNPDDWKDKDWADAESVASFRIVDPACGSGTLLAAASWQLLDNFSRAHFAKHGGRFGGKEKEHPQISLQRSLVEKVIWGYDILETAAHLTATTMGLMSPETDFKKAHIYRAMIGDTQSGAAAGSLELLESNAPIFRRETQVEKVLHNGAIPPLDLCIMNPPFVRGQRDHRSYSFLAESERLKVQKRMNELGKRNGFSNDKGLGAAFVALACQERDKETFIKEGGRLAVILPSTVAAGMGNAWKKTRAKIEKDFNLETVIVSREDGRPNFSENTNLQECILIAQRRGKNDRPTEKALFCVLHKNPKNNEQALATMQAINRARKSGEKVGDLRAVENKTRSLINGKIGRFAMLDYRGKCAWHGVSFSDVYLAFIAANFSRTGKLFPYATGKISLVRFGDVASFGGHTLDLLLNHDDFRKLEIVNYKMPYAGYYPSHYKRKTGIGHKDIGQVSESPNCYLRPLPGCEEWAEKYFSKAGRIILNHSMGFNTARRLATLVSEPVQASHYWPIKLHKENEEKLKVMTLWLNSTPMLLLIANAAQSTAGTKVGFSQAAAKELSVLDLESLDAKQIAKAAAVFDDIVKSDGLLPLPKMTVDGQRKKIDDLFSDILNLGDLAPLRAALAVEPIITGKAAGVAAD